MPELIVRSNNYLKKLLIVGLLGGAVLGFALYFFWAPLTERLGACYEFLCSKEKIRDWLVSYGAAAPVLFVIIQALQVILAPIPGEATGFLGGFLFGSTLGFILSTIGLTLGSLLAFLLGRWLEVHFVEKVVRRETLDRFNFIIERQGTLVAFLLFLLPGFPKDYLCFILGLSKMPLKVFLLIVTLGRMPGTLMLSLQGAKVYDGEYLMVGLLLLLFFLLAVLMYFHKEKLYSWLHRLSQN